MCFIFLISEQLKKSTGFCKFINALLVTVEKKYGLSSWVQYHISKGIFFNSILRSLVGGKGERDLKDLRLDWGDLSWEGGCDGGGLHDGGCWWRHAGPCSSEERRWSRDDGEVGRQGNSAGRSCAKNAGEKWRFWGWSHWRECSRGSGGSLLAEIHLKGRNASDLGSSYQGIGVARIGSSVKCLVKGWKVASFRQKLHPNACCSLPLCSSVLIPGLDLSVRQIELCRQFLSVLDWKIFLLLKTPL